jgi:hypothetical protein
MLALSGPPRPHSLGTLLNLGIPLDQHAQVPTEVQVAGRARLPSDREDERLRLLSTRVAGHPGQDGWNAIDHQIVVLVGIKLFEGV